MSVFSIHLTFDIIHYLWWLLFGSAFQALTRTSQPFASTNPIVECRAESFVKKWNDYGKWLFVLIPNSLFIYLSTDFFSAPSTCSCYRFFVLSIFHKCRTQQYQSIFHTKRTRWFSKMEIKNAHSIEHCVRFHILLRPLWHTATTIVNI